jgi:hypothetical protein
VTAYRFLVADLLTGIVREEIPFSSVKFGDVLNAPGSFSAATPISLARNGYDPITRNVLDPGRTAIHVERDGVIVWSGILWTVRANVTDQTIEYGAEGLWSYFRRRTIRTDTTFTGIDQAAIAQQLVTTAQSVPGGDLGIVVGSETTGRLRDRDYVGTERKPIGEAIEQLAAVIDGFDFSISSAWNAGMIESTFEIHYPRRGTRTAIVVDLNGPIGGFEYTIDATVQANEITAIGADNGTGPISTVVSDPDTFTGYPLLEDVLSLTDVSDLDTLDDHARNRLAAIRLPVATIPNVEFRPSGDLTIGAITTGDELRVIANAGYVNVDAWYRVVSWEIEVDENGTETMRLTFADAGAFA